MRDKLNESDWEELARLIKTGITSGRVDDGEGKHIAWDLILEVWEDK